MMPVQMYGVGVKQIELLLKVQARIMLIKRRISKDLVSRGQSG